MTALDLRQWLQSNQQAADAALAASVDLAAAGDIEGLLSVLDELRLRSYACGVLAADLARLSAH